MGPEFYYNLLSVGQSAMIQTRMKTFIKTMFKKSDDQTNIDKYKVAANITEYHIIINLP